MAADHLVVDYTTNFQVLVWFSSSKYFVSLVVADLVGGNLFSFACVTILAEKFEICSF